MSWFFAYRYPDMDSALVGFRNVTDINSEEVQNMSVRRIGFGGCIYVIVGGDEELEQTPRKKLERALVGGELAVVPDEIRRWHFARRQQQTRGLRSGDRREEHYHF